MKLSKIIQAVAGVAALGFGMSAQAVPVQWTDTVGYGLIPDYIGAGETYRYTHNILDNGYNRLTDTLTSASLSIKLADDALFGDLYILGDGQETVGFSFDNGQWIKKNVDNEFLNWEQFNFTLTSLLQDGVLNVTIKAISGDFVFGGSRLDVTADRASVPEPATLGLFGLGLLATGFAARRRSAK